MFAEEAADWEEAILMSCRSLEADNTVESNYGRDIVECVTPYLPEERMEAVFVAILLKIIQKLDLFAVCLEVCPYIQTSLRSRILRS